MSIVVLKVGTSTIVRSGRSCNGVDESFDNVSSLAGDLLTNGESELAVSTLALIADTVLVLRRSGCKVVLVTSGAVGLGARALRAQETRTLAEAGDDPPEKRAKYLANRQAYAAVGQSLLINTWQHLLQMGGQSVAQVLLTSGDLGNKYQYDNARNTLFALLDKGVIPVVNENDTVATDELRYGDNDWLSALVATAVNATWLFLLSDVHQMHTADPRSNNQAMPIDVVEDIETLSADLGGQGSRWGTGGMRTKVAAARLATAAGVQVCLVHGRTPSRVLNYVHAIEPYIGTLFKPLQAPLRKRRKRWISHCLPPRGDIFVDEGADKAIRQHCSLLAAGVVAVSGNFERNSAVRICARDGTELARGLCNFSSQILKRIQGLRSDDANQKIGYPVPVEVVDRDNLALLVSSPKGSTKISPYALCDGHASDDACSSD